MPDKPDALTISEQPQNFLQVLEKVASTPGMSVDVIERMLAVQERLIADQRKTAFAAAMSRVTPLLPHIKKNGTVSYETRSGGKVETKYALLEDIDTIIRPIISGEGFSQSYDSDEIAGKIKVTIKVTHQEGHFETRSLSLPLDSSGAKNGAQAVKSTISYGRRILTEMFWNLIEEGTDIDGNDLATIDAEQVRDIETQLQDLGMNRERFLKLLAVDKVENILVRDLRKVANAFEVKRESNAKAKK